MENCFVSPLMASADNNNLKKLGVVNVTYVADGSKAVQIGLDKGGEIVCKNGTFSIPALGLSGLTSYKKTDVVTGSTTIVPSAGNIEFELSVYNLFRFTGYGLDGLTNIKTIVEDASELNFIGTLLESTISKVFNVGEASFGGVMSFKDSAFWNSLTQIIIGNDGEREFSLNFNELESATITDFRCPNNLVELNIEDNNMPNLKFLDLPRNPNIYGDLKVWAEKVWNNGEGRTSGSCRILTADSGWDKTQLIWDGIKISAAIPGVYNPYIIFHQNEAPTLSATNS